MLTNSSIHFCVTVTGKKSNKWSVVTIRLGKEMVVVCD